MTDLAMSLAKFCTATGPAALLAVLGSFVLPPLAVWENVPVRTIAVLVSIFGAWVAFYRLKTKRWLLIRWGAMLALLICAPFLYNFLLNHDPKAEHLTRHHVGAVVCFFASYLFLGFCSGEACRFLIPEFFAKKAGMPKGETAVPKSTE